MSVSREQLVRRAGVDDDYVHRLQELGALLGHDDAYEERDVHVAALLHMWERAGLSVPAILAAVDAGTLSLDFLDSPAWALPEPLPITYRELAEEHGIPPHLLQGIQEAMGFAAPDPDDPVPPADTVLDIPRFEAVKRRPQQARPKRRLLGRAHDESGIRAGSRSSGWRGRGALGDASCRVHGGRRSSGEPQRTW